MKKDDQHQPTAQQFTTIGEGTKFVGDITTDGDVSINGEFKGNISTTGALTVGKMANIQGKVQALAAKCAGKVVGTLTIEHRLELLHTALIEGDIITTLIKVEEGALVNGKIVMKQGKLSSTAAE